MFSGEPERISHLLADHGVEVREEFEVLEILPDKVVEQGREDPITEISAEGDYPNIQFSEEGKSNNILHKLISKAQ